MMPDPYTYESEQLVAAASSGVNVTPEHILDAWSFFDYKHAFRTGHFVPNGPSLPSWVPQEERRRLRAYQLLDAIYKLCARRWLAIPQTSPEEMKERREYGDPYLIVEAVMSSVLGDDQSIAVQGVLPDEQGSSSNASAAADLLNEWSDKENFSLKMTENERNAQKYGDSVYVLGWDTDKKRPRLRVYDPGFYFPVEDPRDDEEYPSKVHIAYEFEEEDETRVGDEQKRRYVRRLTWELVEGASYSLPWNEDPTKYHCLYSDITWELGDSRGDVDDFNISAADEVAADSVDLGIDFIPVVHIPNMAVEGCWGMSVLAPVVQLLDDIAANDTDLQKSASLTGSPVLGLHGAQAPVDDQGRVTRYGPGDILETGDGGLDMVDTSRSLDALLKLIDHQLDRLSVNARTPGTLLGRVDPSKVQSGIILTLSFAPHTTMVREMRRIRDVKYKLLLKFVLRMYAINKVGKLDAADLPLAEMKFGSYLPSDKTEVSGIITAMLNGQGMSLETAVRMALDAGYPIDDIQQEVERIQRRDFKGASGMVDATNDTQAARDYLGLGPAPSGTTEAEQQQLQLESQKLSNEQKQQQIDNPQPPQPANQPPRNQ